MAARIEAAPTHVTPDGRAKMVDVGAKPVTSRHAHARCFVELGEGILQSLVEKQFLGKKGPILATATVAGVMAAKKTSELIPMCHPISLDNCDIVIEVDSPTRLAIHCYAGLCGKTGVEMEALVGATVAALTIYDMCKSLSHAIRIENVELMEKKGGKSDFTIDTASSSSDC